MSVPVAEYVILGQNGSEFCYKAYLSFAIKKIDYQLHQVNIRDLQGELLPPYTMPQMLYAGAPPAGKSEPERKSGGVFLDSSEILEFLDIVAPSGPPLFPQDHNKARVLHDEISSTFKCFTRYWFMLDYEGRWNSFGPRVMGLLPCCCQCRCATDLILSSKMEEFRQGMAPILKEKYGVDVDDPEAMLNAWQGELKRYNDMLEEAEWLAGTPDISAADVALFSMLAKVYKGTASGAPCKPGCLEKYPKLKAWFEKIDKAYPIPFTTEEWSPHIWNREKRKAILESVANNDARWSDDVFETWQSVPCVRKKLEQDQQNV